MKKTTRFALALLALFIIILGGCANKPPVKNSNNDGVDTPPTEENTETPEEENGVEETDEDVQAELSMRDFFLPDGSNAHYVGEGNEFAELDIEIKEPFDDYIIAYENNGGSYMQMIYKIGVNKIDLLSQEMIEFDPKTPTLEELQQMEPIDTYLQQPFTVGETFGDWTIIEVDATIDTPYKTFDNAIVIEHVDVDFTNRKYFVPGTGEVKRESIMQIDGEEDFIVTSTLQSID